MATKWLAATAVALLVAFAVPISADHPQSFENGLTVTFTEKTGGNAWWVEVIVGSSRGVSNVEVMDDGGPWAAMTYHHDWGTWALSYPIEAGHRVTFRATTSSGVMTSCPFTHPGAVEQCATPPPPSPPVGWQVRRIDDTEGTGGDPVALGDAANLGREDVFVGTNDGILRYMWAENGWQRQRIHEGTVHEGHYVTAMIIGDSHGDLGNELYAGDLYGISRIEWDGERFWETGRFETGNVVGMATGDVDQDGMKELWYGRPDGTLWRIETAGTTHTTTQMARFGDTVAYIEVADVDADGRPEVVVGSHDDASVHVVEVVGETAIATRVAHEPGDTGVSGLVVTDLEGDGSKEIYSLAILNHHLKQTRWTGSGYSTTTVGSYADAPLGLTAGDANTDGKTELYVRGGGGHVLQVRHTVDGWLQADLGLVGRYIHDLAFGDPDRDGRPEAYVLADPASDCCTKTVLYQMSDHAPAPVLSSPAGWKPASMGSTGMFSPFQAAIGDTDGDGRNEVFATGVGDLLRFTKGARGWESMVVAQFDSNMALAVGDGDNDGKVDIYGASGSGLTKYTWNGTGYTRSEMGVYPSTGFVHDITVGDLDGDGRRELYFTTIAHPQETTSGVYKASFSAGAWRLERIASVPTDGETVWIADADNDGRLDLVVGSGDSHGNGYMHRVSFVNGAWVTERMAGVGSSNIGMYAVAGDPDRDGRNEAYGITADGQLIRTTKASGAWASTVIANTPRPMDLHIADADNDGRTELYTVTMEGTVERVAWTGSFWERTTLYTFREPMGSTGAWPAMAVADADGDGKSEIYVGFSYRAYYSWGQMYALSTSTPAPSDTFTAVRGNEWWVQASVAGNPAQVHVRLNGGDWKPLAKQSWAPTAWAASYHIPQGTLVQLRATSSTGASVLSICYQWIPSSNADARMVACTSTPPPPTGFDATFTNVKGNEWWVQAHVRANSGHTIIGVEVRVDGGAWQPLAKQSWGTHDWALSTHLPEGSRLEFRARSGVDGASELSDGCYRWIPPSGQVAQARDCSPWP